jgi:O-antigen/teichoic acid export membrane protein
MGYTDSVFKGVGWISAFKILSRLASFLKIAVIARILTPAQFGIFGIASLVLTFLEILTETGINVILVQTNKDIKDYLNSAWVVSILRGILLSLLIIGLSPLAVYFFKAPQAYTVMLVIALVPLIRGFINPSVVKFQKELKFKYEFVFRSSVFLFDAFFTAVFVVLTHSVYGLIFGLLAGALLEVILSFVFVKPVPKFTINREYISQIFHKGKWVTAFGILGYFGDQGDNIVVGKILGTSSLGIYQMIFKISILPLSEISDAISRVVFPVYVKIEEDKKRLKKAFLKTTFLVSITTFILGLIIFLFPGEIILILLGDKWLSGTEILRVLSLYGVIRGISGSVTALFLAVKKQSYVTVMSFFRVLVLGLTIFPLVMIFGIIGAAYAALLSVLSEMPIVIYYLYIVFRSKK